MINLLPDAIKKERVYGRRNFSMLLYSVSLIAVAGITTAIMLVSLQIVGSDETKLQNDINEYETQIRSLEADVAKIEEVATRLNTAKEVSDLSVKFSELVPQIGAVLPQGVVLNALSLTGGITDPLQLDVDIVDASLAPILARNLTESDLFEAADIASLTPRGSEDQEEGSYSFSASLTASFAGSADAKKKAAAREAAAAKAAEEAQASGGTAQ